MAWWNLLFRRPSPPYRVAFELYSRDGERGAEVREHRDGSWWYVDLETSQGAAFRYRGAAEEIGPFNTPEAAESAVVTRAWFNDGVDRS